MYFLPWVENVRADLLSGTLEVKYKVRQGPAIRWRETCPGSQGILNIMRQKGLRRPKSDGTTQAELVGAQSQVVAMRELPKRQDIGKRSEVW